MPASDLTTFIGRIEAALEMKSLRKTDLAAHLGISKQYLGQILNGQRPGYEFRTKLAAFCGVSLQWLMTGTNPPDWAVSVQVDATDQIRRLNLIINALTDQLGAAQEEIASLKARRSADQERKHGDGPRATGR